MIHLALTLAGALGLLWLAIVLLYQVLKGALYAICLLGGLLWLANEQYVRALAWLKRRALALLRHRHAIR